MTTVKSLIRKAFSKLFKNYKGGQPLLYDLSDADDEYSGEL